MGFMSRPRQAPRRFSLATNMSHHYLGPANLRIAMSPALLVLSTLTTALLAGIPATRAAAVDLGLVLAIDVSESIDDEEYQLQHEGIARAFEDRAISDAIRAGNHGVIDALVLEWSDRDKQVVTVDWTRID